jgi:hypothetical protein
MLQVSQPQAFRLHKEAIKCHPRFLAAGLWAGVAARELVIFAS